MRDRPLKGQSVRKLKKTSTQRLRTEPEVSFWMRGLEWLEIAMQDADRQ